MTDSQRPIGVFDSGVGGLTVASALMRRLPGESILYLGDTARLPYGTKSSATVERYTRRNIDFLVRRGAKAVVIACNTASAVLGESFDTEVPVWGVIEPGAEEAVRRAEGGSIGVLATESTIRSGAYTRAIHRWNPDLEVIDRPCPLFVPLVEEGWLDDPVSEMVAERYVRPVIEAGCRTLVMGCTHYPMLGKVLRRVAGPEVQWVDSAWAVAHYVDEQLQKAGLKRQDGAAPKHHLCATDAGERFGRIARRLLTHYSEEEANSAGQLPHGLEPGGEVSGDAGTSADTEASDIGVPLEWVEV